ncbi:plant-specific B3-DNA-binding domain protein [Medicago truncatula]|nr:plant-specific B3-DNA-binding domain protein [Medicago truncatula]
MTNNAKEYPNFFKVFLTKKHSDRMLIPTAFVKLMISKQRLLKDFILRDHRGSDWHVKVCSIGNKLYFDDGWKLFREENSLEDNDFLVFTHIENNVFKFKILELSSMCQKMKVMDEEENTNTIEDEEEADGDDDYTMVEEEEDSDDNDDVDEEEDEDVADIIMKEKRNKGAGKGINRSCEHQHGRTFKRWSIGSSSAAPNLEDDEIDAEMYIQPGNPYFYAKHYDYRPNILNISKNVIKDFCLCFTKHITIVCCHCKDVQSNGIAAYRHILPQMRTKHIEKRGEVRKWKDGRVFVRGWEDFCRKSKITENDKCLCELVLRNGKSIEMLRVHVVREK